jgi:hypothetical protein
MQVHIIFDVFVTAAAILGIFAWIAQRTIDRRRMRLIVTATDLELRDGEVEVARAQHAEAAARATAEAATRRADNQFHCIEDTCQERDGIWTMYREQVLGAGAAQDLLWSELERMRRFILAKSSEHNFEMIVPSAELQQVLGRYTERHRDEAAAKAGALQAKEEIRRRNDGLAQL